MLVWEVCERNVVCLFFSFWVCKNANKIVEGVFFCLLMECINAVF